jgi:quinol-cytochrome oxidoreductase complex cytochrome b subunit
MSEAPDTGAEAPQSAAGRLFDLRSLIGGLFVVYGIMLTVAGFSTSAKNLAKASNININLWMGIGMLIVGVLFILWWRLNPVRHDQPRPDTTGTGQ